MRAVTLDIFAPFLFNGLMMNQSRAGILMVDPGSDDARRCRDEILVLTLRLQNERNPATAVILGAAIDSLFDDYFGEMMCS